MSLCVHDHWRRLGMERRTRHQAVSVALEEEIMNHTEDEVAQTRLPALARREPGIVTKRAALIRLRSMPAVS